MKLLGIDFAPLNVPLERRLQTLAVLYALTEYMFGSLSYLIVFALLFTQYYYIPLLYFTWMYYDRHSCRQGSGMEREGSGVSFTTPMTIYFE
jgi:hypothetical protein